MRYFAFLFFTLSLQAFAQGPRVPAKMHFAGMTLTIRDDARKEIQKDVDALTQSPKYFNIKVERAKTYFPLIEKIFQEEELPDDFKYLVIQESALIPDAVSVSKAVGFWQFKDFTAIEMGLRVDREVDERLNIISSSRAAARYIKKNNYLYFNNWLYALQAYQMGAGGVMQTVSDSKPGATHMEITSKTYWYVKKYLAHKIAFEEAVKDGHAQLQLMAHESKGKKSLRDIAREVAAEEDDLKAYNKWLKAASTPDDKMYAVLFPVTDKTRDQYLAAYPAATEKRASRVKEVTVSNTTSGAKAIQRERIKINGVTAIKAKPGETSVSFAARAGIDLSYFLKCNDLSVSDKIEADKYYFISKKRTRAQQAYHKVAQQETLWEISQNYGVQLQKIRKFNRMSGETKVETGTVLYLSANKPKNRRGAQPVEVVLVDKDKTFSWSVEPEHKPQNPVTVEPPLIASLAIGTDNEDVNPLSFDADTLRSHELSERVEDTVAMQSPVADDSAAKIVKTERPGQHIVKAGETLYAISKNYGVEVMEIVYWNQLDLKDGIKPGQVLKLDGKKYEEITRASVGSGETIHEVKASDTLYSIARKYGVTIKELMDWNGKTDFTVSLGEKLRVIQR